MPEDEKLEAISEALVRLLRRQDEMENRFARMEAARGIRARPSAGRLDSTADAAAASSARPSFNPRRRADAHTISAASPAHSASPARNAHRTQLDQHYRRRHVDLWRGVLFQIRGRQ